MKGLEKIIFIGVLYLIFASAAILWGTSYDSGQLREHLKWASPLAMEINFFLILAGIVVNLSNFKTALRSITRKTLILALITALAAILITMFIAPRIHRIFYDEDIYLNVGQNIADLKKAGMCNEGRHRYGEYSCNRMEYNKDPNAWPYLASLVFRIIGPSHLAGFLLNNLIWGLSVLTVFFIGFFLFKDEKAGLFGALMFALIPEGLRWSNTAAVEPSSALFTGLAVLAVIFFARYPGNRSLFLASVMIPLSFQFRAESGMVLLPAGLVLLLITPKELAKERTYALLLLCLILALPHFIQLYAVKGEGWGAPDGVKFATKYFKENFRVNGLFYLKNKRFPVLFTLFFFIGLGMPLLTARKNGESLKTKIVSFFGKEKLVLLSWFLAFWGIFLVFYAGSYNYGADVRFSLLSYIPLSVLAGFGAAALSKWAAERFSLEWTAPVLSLLIGMWAVSFFPYVSAETQEAWAARADHHYAQIMAETLPPDSLVLTHNPNMFLLWGQSAAQASIATYDIGYLRNLYSQYEGGIYFHYNFWCNVSNPTQQSFCNNILNRFKTTEILAFQEQNYRYRLYKIELK
jgi:hypothetical protein